MPDTHKLLMALCDALGFEVENIVDYQRMKETKASAMIHNGPQPSHRTLLMSGSTGGLDIDEDGLYTSVLRQPVTDYKLTKKARPPAVQAMKERVEDLYEGNRG